jgi:hypothetical protein
MQNVFAEIGDSVQILQNQKRIRTAVSISAFLNAADEDVDDEDDEILAHVVDSYAEGEPKEIGPRKSMKSLWRLSQLGNQMLWRPYVFYRPTRNSRRAGTVRFYADWLKWSLLYAGGCFQGSNRLKLLAILARKSSNSTQQSLLSWLSVKRQRGPPVDFLLFSSQFGPIFVTFLRKLQRSDWSIDKCISLHFGAVLSHK